MQRIRELDMPTLPLSPEQDVDSLEAVFDRLVTMKKRMKAMQGLRVLMSIVTFDGLVYLVLT